MTPETSGMMESLDHEARQLIADYRKAQYRKFMRDEKKRAEKGLPTISRPMEELDPDMPVKEIEEFLRQTRAGYKAPKIPREVVEVLRTEEK
jgi:hypothetical protein